MDNIALFVEVLPLVRADGQGAVTAHVAVEEVEGVAAGDDAGALVVQQGRRVAFQDGDVVA